MIKRFLSMFCYAALFAHSAAAASVPQLEPFVSLLNCAQDIKLEARNSRATFLACATSQFAKEVNSQLAERIAFWIASGPTLDRARLCSPEEAKLSGDLYHSSAVGCFEVLDADHVKTGYIFLRHESDHWSIIDIKF